MAWAPSSPSAASPPLHLFDKGYNLASAAFVGSLRSYEPTHRRRDTAQSRNDGSMSSRSVASCSTARSTSSRKSMPPHLTGETHSELADGKNRLTILVPTALSPRLTRLTCMDVHASTAARQALEAEDVGGWVHLEAKSKRAPLARHAPQRSIPKLSSNSALGGMQFARDSGLTQATGIGRPLSCIRYGRPSTGRRSLRTRPATRLALSTSSLAQLRTRSTLTTRARPAAALDRDPYRQLRLHVGPAAAALFMALLAARYLLSRCRISGEAREHAIARQPAARVIISHLCAVPRLPCSADCRFESNWRVPADGITTDAFQAFVASAPTERSSRLSSPEHSSPEGSPRPRRPRRAHSPRTPLQAPQPPSEASEKHGAFTPAVLAILRESTVRTQAAQLGSARMSARSRAPTEHTTVRSASPRRTAATALDAPAESARTSDDALPQEHALSAACLQALRAERLGRRIVAGIRTPSVGAE